MKSFVIGLSQIPTSAASAHKVINKLKSYDLDAQLWEGTMGHEAEEIFSAEGRTLYPVTIKNTPHTLRETAKQTRLGVMGCFHSHYRLWHHCANLQESILIFEDDVIFERGFYPVEWDDVLLLATGKSVYKNEFYHKRLFHPEGEPAAGKFKGKVMPGAVGYGLTPTGAEKLVKKYKHYYLPADNCMNHSTVRLNCHTHLMGRAAVKVDSKKSLTKTNAWTKMQKSSNFRIG